MTDTELNAFDRAMAFLDAPLVVVTADNGKERAGCLVGFHGQGSIEPRRYGVWLSKANLTYRVALHSEYLAVHLLDRSQRALAELFGGVSGDDVDKFARCRWREGPHGVPLVEGPRAVIVGRRVGVFDVDNDHTCFVLEAEHVTLHDDLDHGEPFRVSDAEGIDGGHPAEDRPKPERAESD